MKCIDLVSFALAVGCVSAPQLSDAAATRTKEKILYSFTGGADGGSPAAGFVADAKGNLYSTSYAGGAFDDGTVYELSPTGKETVLYSFKGGSDGQYPQSTLVTDAQGNLYGTTTQGGSADLGTVFKLAPDGSETVLWSFAGGYDGAFPMAGVIIDGKGNLTGTTEAGGGSQYCGGGCGTVYEIDSKTRETVLYAFNGSPDGAYPLGGLYVDTAGHLLGTTLGGGVQSNYCGVGCGTAFELSPGKQGWTESVIYAFQPDTTDGTNPAVGFIADASGNLFGTATIAGNQNACLGGCGTVFKLSRGEHNSWMESTVYAFQNTDGRASYANLVADPARNFYGVTLEGGPDDCPYSEGCGVVFKLSPKGRETVLHGFTGTPGDGANPQGALYLDSSGNLVGTTTEGGAVSGCFEDQGCGAVFHLKE